LVLVLCTFVFSVSSSCSLFDTWKVQHLKKYSSQFEHVQRYIIWKQNVAFIEEHNQLFLYGNVSFQVAMNQFGDLTALEFGQRYFQRIDVDGDFISYQNLESFKYDLPDSFDWRTKGVVPAVRNQGQCGGAGVFAEVDAIECLYHVKNSKVLNIDINRLASCMSGSGCNGGPVLGVYKYIMKCGAPSSSTSLPPKCKYDEKSFPPIIDAYTIISSGNENSLAEALVNVAPISVMIDASRSSFQFYHSGVYYESSCSSTQLDHALLLVGYGTSNGKKFWSLKNSWGIEWGMNGYIDMSKDRNNNCGIATYANYPKLGDKTYKPDSTCNRN